MKTTFLEKRRKILRTIFGALSFSTALFVFQACYGAPKDNVDDICIQGTVLSKTTNLPISGVKVSIENQSEYGTTDASGKFIIYTSATSNYKIKFDDIDLTKDGAFSSSDTTIKFENVANSLTIFLNEK